MSDSVRPHRLQPTRLPRPWDSPGKNTEVGCHFLLQCMKVKRESHSVRHVRLLATPWTAAYQTPPSMGFSRQEHWSGLPLPSPNQGPRERQTKLFPFWLIWNTINFAQVFSPEHIYWSKIKIKVIYNLLLSVFKYYDIEKLQYNLAFLSAPISPISVLFMETKNTSAEIFETTTAVFTYANIW